MDFEAKFDFQDKTPKKATNVSNIPWPAWLRITTFPSTTRFHHLSNEKKPGWLGYIGDYITHLYRDYYINHDKDPS